MRVRKAVHDNKKKVSRFGITGAMTNTKTGVKYSCIWTQSSRKKVSGMQVFVFWKK